MTYFSLMGILGEKESCLSSDEKYNDIWFKAADGEDAVPSADPLGCLAYCDLGEAAGLRDRLSGELDELGDTNTF